MKLVTLQFVMITCLLMVCVVGTWTRRQIPFVFDQPEVSTDASDDFIVGESSNSDTASQVDDANTKALQLKKVHEGDIATMGSLYDEEEKPFEPEMDTGDVGLGSDPSTLPPLDIEGEIEGELVLKPKYAIYGRVSKLENRLSKLEAEVERINSILSNQNTADLGDVDFRVQPMGRHFAPLSLIAPYLSEDETLILQRQIESDTLTDKMH